MIEMKPSLIIGLGGTGKLICKLLKGCFQQRYKKEFLDGVTGLPPTVDVLYIEADFGKEREEFQLPELPEVEGIVAEIPETKFGVIQSKEYLDQNPEIREWLASPLPIKEVVDGAGQIRQAGRLAFFENRKKDKRIEPQIRDRIKDLTGDTTLRKAQRKGIKPEPGLDVYIIASLCGGTGSGMLFDIAGIIKAAKSDARITLISLFPKIFTENIDVTESVQNMYANTYATLKELDHYMRYNAWEVTYGESEKIRVGGSTGQKRLFDYVFFVDIEGKGGKNLQDRLHISPLLAEFLYQSLTSLGESLSAHRANIDRYSTSAQWCASFGLSILSFPLEEVLAVCVNRLKKEAVATLSMGEYTSREIEEKISDKNIGLLHTTFRYANWMKDLCKTDVYHLQSSQSIIASGKKKVYTNLKKEKQRVEFELKVDKETISQNFENILNKTEKELDKVVEGALVTKGSDYALTLLNNFKMELNSTNLKSEQGGLKKSVSELGKAIERDLKTVEDILSKRFDLFGYWKRCAPNITAVLRIIKKKAESELRMEKIHFVIMLLNEVAKEKGFIDKRTELIGSLKANLNQLKSHFSSEEERSWDRLSFIASAETKLIANYEEVNNFYNHYFEGEAGEIEKDLRKHLSSWLRTDLEEITGKIGNTTGKRIKQKGLGSLTIKDIIKDNDLNRRIAESFEYAQPFWQHAAKDPMQDAYFISGFTKNELQNYPSIRTAKDVYLSDPVDKRRMVFLTLEYRVPLAALKAFGLKDWGEDYQAFMTGKEIRKWVHLTPAALGFEDPLGIPVGMEEEDLLQTCRDLGIIFQKGSYYEYKKISKKKDGQEVKEEVIAEGFDNCIRKLKEKPSLSKELSKKAIGALNNMPIEEVKNYLNNHNLETYHHDREAFFKAHVKNYKDAGSGKEIPSHRIPSYIEKEVKKRFV